MWRRPPHNPVIALEANLAGAGMALACCYSGSDEYEAEIIRVRRDAGAYRPRRSPVLLIGALGVALALALFV